MILNKTVLWASLFGILSIQQANAADYSLSFAHVLSEKTPNGRAALHFKEEVEKNSDGRIEVQVLPAAQVGGDIEIIEQLQMGLVDIAIPPTATLGNFEPKMQVFDLPFILPGYDSMIKVMDGDIGKDLLEELSAHNMKGLAYWGAGFRQMTNNSNSINSPEDIESLRIRTMESPVIISTYKNFNANPTAMPIMEVYNSLQQGVFDGQENPLANIESFRLHEVQDYLTISNHAYHGYAAVVNNDKWESLPSDLQAIVEDAFITGRDLARKLTKEEESAILSRIGDSVNVNELSSSQVEAFIDASMPVHNEYSDVFGEDLLERFYTSTRVGEN